MAVTLNPEHRQELLQHFNAPYEAQKQNIMLNLQRQGQAGSLAGQLMEKKEQDRLRKAQLEFQVYQKNWAREQAASNAGVTNFPYTIPGMGESAQANARYKGARTSYWERGNQPHATGRFKSKADYLAFLDNQLFKTRSQFFAATAGPLATGESATDIQAKIDDPNTPEKERSYYRTQLPMAGMTEEVQQAHDELKNRVIPAINAMPEAAFPEFMSKSGAEQAEIIELLLKRPLSPSGRRIIMEGSTATPLQPSPPPEEQEGASGWPF